MKKISVTIALLTTIGLGGCASLQTAWSVITSASVTPQQIIVAANAFDGFEATATQYLTYCKTNTTVSACTLATRQKVVAAVKAGQAARNQLEPYVVSGSAGPSTIFNTLVAAINVLQTSVPTTTPTSN
jgi:hypothetical protein